MMYNEILKKESMTLNHEGAEAWRLTPEMELYTLACTIALQPTFYESPKEQVDRLCKLVTEVDAQFVARLAVYARQKMYLRSVPLLLAVELAKVHNDDNLVSRTIEQVVMRADEIAELLMCYQWRNPQPGIKKLGHLSHQVQEGLSRAFNKFDEYQFAKYDRDAEVRLRDALFIIHPKAKSAEQQAVFDKIANKSLAVPYTWETELSALGQQHFDDDDARRKAFANKWEELVSSGKLGYMALMRNLRNIVEASIDEKALLAVADRIGSLDEVVRARQLPFRYLAAYKELVKLKSPSIDLLLMSLEHAVELSALNIKGFNRSDSVFVACDMSASMQYPISRNGTIYRYEVGNVLAMMLHVIAGKVTTGIFGDEWKTIDLPPGNILANTASLGRRIGEVGYGTEGEKPLKWLVEKEMTVDKVLYFTDCQFWENEKSFQRLWNKYKQIAPKARLYLFDLAGYGQSPVRMPGRDVVMVAGWSDRIFDMLDAIDRGGEIVDEIKGMTL